MGEFFLGGLWPPEPPRPVKGPALRGGSRRYAAAAGSYVVLIVLRKAAPPELSGATRRVKR